MRSRRIAAVGAVLSLALVVSGCATTKTAGFTASAAPGTVGGDSNPSPGVTADSVKVGAIFTDVGTVSKTLGFQSDPLGDPDAQVKALMQWVNANGGMGGRTLELVPKVYPASTDSPQAEEALCRFWTQDEKVFGVILTGQLQANARKCYAKGRTVMVDNASYPLDRQGYDELKPFLWAPGIPVLDDFLPQWVTSLKDQKFFDGSKLVGVIAADTPVNRRAYDTLLKPELDQAGVTAQEIGYVDTLSVESINTSLFQIAQTYKQKGVDRVMFLGGARLAALCGLQPFGGCGADQRAERRHALPHGGGQRYLCGAVGERDDALGVEQQHRLGERVEQGHPGRQRQPGLGANRAPYCHGAGIPFIPAERRR